MTNPPTQALTKAAQAVQARKRRVDTPKASKRAKIDAMRPTEERECKNTFRSAGMARKVRPPIDVLKEQGHLTPEQHEVLALYAEQAHLAGKSPTRDSCDFSVRGGSGDVSLAIVSARIQTAVMENRMGQFVSIGRAIARDEMTIAQYCVERFGGRERYDKRGRFVAVVPKREKAVTEDARRELRKAANNLIG